MSRILTHNMARGKRSGIIFVILSVSIFTRLVHCRSLQLLSANDEEGDFISDAFMSDQAEQVEQFDYPSDDVGVTDLQRTSILKGQLVSSSEAAWSAMSPKLKCGDHLMKLQLQGPEVEQVELCRGNADPVPLSQLPPHCGSTTPTFGGLVYVTPYDGCGVARQGGSYIMQMQWRGNPVVMSCPVTSASANDTMPVPYSAPHDGSVQSPPGTPGSAVAPEASMPGYPNVFFPHNFYSHYAPYQFPVGLPSKPETDGKPVPESAATSTTSTTTPQPHGYPQVFPHFYPFNYYYHQRPGPFYPIGDTEKPSTTISLTTAKPIIADVPTHKPQHPFYPQMFFPYYYNHYHYPGRVQPKPELTGIPVTTAASTSAPTQKPQSPFYPPFMSYYYPHYHYPGMPPKPKPTTSASTPTDVHAPTQKPQPPGYPQMFWPYYYHHHYPHKPVPTEKPASTAVPTTSASTPTIVHAPTQKPQPPGYPQMFWPYYYYHHHYPHKPMPTEKPPSTAVPTTSASTPTIVHAPTQKPQPHGYPQMFWPYYYHHHYPHKPMPTEKPAPTDVPTTSVVHAPTQKPQPHGYPQMFWPYYYHHHYPHKPMPTEKPAPTDVPTTSVVHAPTQKPQPHGYPQMFWPYYYHHHYPHKPMLTEKPAPNVVPTTPTDVHALTQKPQPPGHPQMFWPYYYHHHYPRKPTTTEKPAPTAAQTTSTQTATQKPQPPAYPPVKPGQPQYSYYPHYHPYLQNFLPHQMEPPNIQTPTTQPITTTTTSQPCTTTTAAECSPSAIYPFEDSVLYEKDPFSLHFVDLTQHMSEYDPKLAFKF